MTQNVNQPEREIKRYTSIQISIETYGQLNKLKTTIEALLDKNISFDTIIQMLVTVKVDWDELFMLHEVLAGEDQP